MRVNAAISDLFFNTDVSSAIITERGDFAGYDTDELILLAQDVLHCLETLGVDDLPTPGELVADFMNRV